ncbi:menin [Acyrthosiphon pisum]|uniref:Menin n=1 Tax=Acyrthosiphon pisum TaxID=7029 RepID=A0A8R1W7S8_ACYPI|nr:menin [Acyrthosiphon pisum]|eukprot:XP_001952417.2 PREDICTED: menin [Acyrthosiphon pisum]
MSQKVFKEHSELFPIRDVPAVVDVFRKELEKKEPDLLLLSLVAGAIENTMTCVRPTTEVPIVVTAETNFDFDQVPLRLPDVELHIVEALYTKFYSLIKSSVDPLHFDDRDGHASRELVKRVSDVIWNTLTRSYYKDRAHLQSMYSYLTGSKLDCFGVAFAVVAACQILGYNDVHLALSEDHAWVVFGPDGSENAEVTWHGKGNEDKRGQKIKDSGPGHRSWLYVNGHPVICNRHMEVSALVSSINPSINQSNDALEVATLQKNLLWLLYDEGHLSKFPLALGNLGDLEELNATPGRPPCTALFEEAISAARIYYSDMFVYPYTYQGGYFYRHNMIKDAFASWANASQVISKYSFSKDDEELYKEMMDIAYELIPYSLKEMTCGKSRSILNNPQCYAYVLLIYDGLCLWEEDGTTPVLHIKWAKHFINSISKFDDSVRTRLIILEPKDSENDSGVLQDYHDTNMNNNNRPLPKEILNTIPGTEEETKSELHPGIKALTAACSERILNREFLLQGGGEPFVGSSDELPIPTSTPQAPTLETTLKDDEPETKIELKSKKMRSMKDLLIAKKLNTQAISLQMSAQSQGGKRHAPRDNAEPISRRSRRNNN